MNSKTFRQQLIEWTVSIVKPNHVPVEVLQLSGEEIAEILEEFKIHGDETRERSLVEIMAPRIPGIAKEELNGREAEIVVWINNRRKEYKILKLANGAFHMVSHFRRKPQVCKTYEEAKNHLMTRINNRFRDTFLRTAESLAKKIAIKNRK